VCDSRKLRKNVKGMGTEEYSFHPSEKKQRRVFAMGVGERRNVFQPLERVDYH